MDMILGSLALITCRLPCVTIAGALVFSRSYGKKVFMRFEQGKTYLLEILGAAPRFTARHYRNGFRKALAQGA